MPIPIAYLSLIDYPSPWPLPKFLYAYSSYIYTQNWVSVILSFYIIKIIYVLFYYLDAGNHPSWFDGLGDYDSTTGQVIEPSLGSVVVGDFLYLLMGILLGKTQTLIINKGYFYHFSHLPNFMTTNKWKSIFELVYNIYTGQFDLNKVIEKYIHDQELNHILNNAHYNVTIDEPTPTHHPYKPEAFVIDSKNKKSNNNSDFIKSANASSRLKKTLKQKLKYDYGVLPLKLIIPLYNDIIYYQKDYDVNDDNINYEFSGEKNDDNDVIQLKYKFLLYLHRKFFWFYFIQTILLGSPATVAYTLGITDKIRSGVLIYYAIQLVLLIIFYFWNIYTYNNLYDSLLKFIENNSLNFVTSSSGKRYEPVEYLNMFLKRKFDIYSRSYYNAHYISWFVTITIFSMFVIINSSLNISLVVIFTWVICLLLWVIVLISYFISNAIYEPLLIILYYL